MILLLGRGEHCPRERQHQREMLKIFEWCAVAFTPRVTKSTYARTIPLEEILTAMQHLLTSYARRINGPFLRFSLAIILAWIGALEFVDPSPVVALLQASLPLLAFNAFVYLVGAVELVVSLLLAPAGEARRMAAQAVTA